jgi:glutamine amidotransferase/cyclase
VYVKDPSETKHTCVKASEAGPNGEEWCWWQCTVKGGREGRDIDAIQLAKAVEAMGAGEIMLNCIDNDGKGQVRCSVYVWWLLARAAAVRVDSKVGSECPEVVRW